GLAGPPDPRSAGRRPRRIDPDRARSRARRRRYGGKPRRLSRLRPERRARRDRGRERGAAAAHHGVDRVPGRRVDPARRPGRDRVARNRLPPLRSPRALAIRERDDRGSPEAAVKDVFLVRRMWRPRSELKKRYDVVVIGGGSHGLATAYYLAKNHGIK